MKTQAFFDYVNERESIRLRKEAGDFFPWTEDPILKAYKFTNVHRHDDKTSCELRRMFYEKHFHDNPASILMNCALFRYFGTYEFAEAVGWQDYDNFQFEEIKEIAKERLSNKQRVFTGAYVITNQGISAPKYEVVVDHFLRDLHKATPSILETSSISQSWELTSGIMSNIKGFGGTGFMTKEVLIDTTYTGFWNKHSNQFSYPVDWNFWTPIGPGALRGASRVLGDESARPVKSDQAMTTIRMLMDEQKTYLTHDFDMSATDVQFNLCEFDKYERVRLGQGRPRSKYHPR